ncbi:MAG: M18 family aminopeptidase [Acidimicrobiales bacterium]
MTDRAEALGLIEFIDASPSPFHACAEAAARLETGGFRRATETDVWAGGPGRGYVVRGGTLVAWVVPEVAAGRPETPFRLIGAHTDSPNLRIKPQPDTGRAGVQQLAVEVYGGVLLNSWLDRDLGLSGRVLVRGDDGGIETRLLLIDRPMLRVPQLASHLDRDVNVKGLLLNPQQHLDPLWACGEPEPGAFARFLAKELAVDERSVLSWDVMAHDLSPSTLLGRDDDFLSAPRIDNLCSTYAAVRALTEAGMTEAGMTDAVAVAVLFDHEEVGSETATGAASPILSTVLERLVLARGGDRQAFHRALAGSTCVSADGAHATHPNFTDRHEPGHWIALNGGPVIKTNVNAHYATDASTAAGFARACDAAGVPVQRYVHRNDMKCGTTIGPITAARLGIPVVDVGAPQLAMHSARELTGALDPGYLVRALTAFLAAG